MAKMCPETPKSVVFYKFHFLANVCPETPKSRFFYKFHFLAKMCLETPKSWVFYKFHFLDHVIPQADVPGHPEWSKVASEVSFC